MSDAIPVPPRPSLEQYKKRAKGLVHACNADDRLAIRAWAADWMESLLGAPGDGISADRRAWVDRQADRIEALARAKVTGAANAPACLLPSEYRGAYGASQNAARRVLADLEWAAG